MKYAPLALFVLALVAATVGPLTRLGAAWAAPAPAERTATPACAPERSGAQAGPRHALALPPGHPPVDPRLLLPPGHPPIAAPDEPEDALPPGPPELPPGHPPIPSSPRGAPVPFDDEPVIHEI